MRLSTEHFKRVSSHHEGPEGGSLSGDELKELEASAVVPEVKREPTEQELKELHLLGNDRLRIADKFIDRKMIVIRRQANEFITHEMHTFFPGVGDIGVKLKRAVTGYHESKHEDISAFERATDAFTAASNVLVYTCILAGETKVGVYASAASHALTYGVPAAKFLFEMAQVGAEKLGEKWTEVVGRLRTAYESMPGADKMRILDMVEEDFEEVYAE